MLKNCSITAFVSCFDVYDLKLQVSNLCFIVYRTLFLINEWCWTRILRRSSVLFEEMELSDDGRDIKNFEDARINVNEDCRICLQKSNEVCQLFPNSKGFSQKLMAIAGVQVEEGDGLPSVICFDCSQLLDISYNFQSQIQKTDTKLREILKLGSCTTKDTKNELKVEDHFSDIIADAILQRKITNNLDNDNKDGEDDHSGNNECSSNIHESSIEIDVKNFTNNEHDFSSEIINDNIDSNDKCNSVIELENKQELYKVVEDIKLPKNCENITDKLNSVTCHTSNLITEITCIKEEISCEETVSESNKSIDQSTVRQEQIFQLERKNELEKLNYNTLMKSSSKIINIQEERKSTYNCSDDEEKPLISRTTRQKCTQCVKSFSTRLALQRHMTVHKHKAELRYVCYICDKQFSSITKLKCHINSRHHDVRFNNKKKERENSDNKDVHLKARDLDNNCNNSMDNTKTEKKNYKFICKVCSKQFTYQKSFLTHAKSHPEYNPEDLNDFSSETGTQLNEIKNKSVQKQNESDDGNNDDIDDIDNDDDNDNDNLPMESPQCTQCGKLFATKRNLKRHISTHSGLKHNCSTCGKVFSRIDKLKDHEQSKHKEYELFGNSEEENEADTDNENKVNDGSNERKKGRHNRPHKCALCPKAFAQQQSLANHIERHKRTKDSQKRFLCEVCSKCFAQSGSLVAHMRTHTGIKPYVCNVCGRAFTKSTYLQLHSRTHSGEKPYICQYCSKAFARANTLARHITMHTGEAKYHCQICTKSFRRLTSLNEHTYTHTGQRPYACKICTKRYNNAGSLYAHTKKCKAQQLTNNSTTTYTVAMDNTLQQSSGPTSQVLIYSQRKLLEDATVGQITPTPQYMIANVHNQKALSTNIMQPFTVEDSNKGSSFITEQSNLIILSILGFYSDLEILGVFYISGQHVVSSTPAAKLDMPTMAMQKMRRQGQDVMQMNLAGIRRDIVNLAHNYSSAQKAVRKATSNDPWGPSSTLMAEIADLTYNVVAFTEIMQMLWKRLNDHGKNWRHVYKALVLLEYLIKTGTEKVAQQCKENIFAIQTLKDFQHMEGHKDQGINVREKAKQLVALLKDDERLKNERARALKAKERFAQTVSGFGSDGLDTMSPVSSDFQDWEPCNLTESASRPELEAARPQTVGEEELQLQLALAMSREEAEQEEQRRRSDDVRLQLALSQSQQDFKAPQTEKQSHMLDLLDVNLGEASSSSAQNDPWSIPVTAPPPRPQSLDLSQFRKCKTQNDPWSIPTTSNNSPAIDPWAPVTSQKQAVINDPWKAPTPSPSAIVTPRSADPWSPAPTANELEASKIEVRQDKIISSSPTFNNPTLTENISFTAQSPQNIGFNLPNPTNVAFGTMSNGFKDPGSTFSNFPSQTHGSSATSPLSELDEFDVISQRNKLGSGSQTTNNGTTLSSDPFDLGGIGESLPQSTGAIKKTPQSFLGENSALVNLDNLVSTSTIKTVTPTPTV
ncbi:PREDICTED: uncharacterized protein LOC107071629 isoform X5 [Polistes dominula]|nr:PREDICTED: uncharacterized protein LOC107071629 isoform X5 [Polistes dominula]